jgi:hypothetical protein
MSELQPRFHAPTRGSAAKRQKREVRYGCGSVDFGPPPLIRSMAMEVVACSQHTTRREPSTNLLHLPARTGARLKHSCITDTWRPGLSSESFQKNSRQATRRHTTRQLIQRRCFVPWICWMREIKFLKRLTCMADPFPSRHLISLGFMVTDTSRTLDSARMNMLLGSRPHLSQLLAASWHARGLG